MTNSTLAFANVQDTESIIGVKTSILVCVAGTILILLLKSKAVRISLQFCYYCFIAPFFGTTEKADTGTDGHQTTLETFYSAQAKIYDITRPFLLKGREESLRLAVSHLSKKTDLVWVDVGGGTGWNVEYMNSILDLSKHFKAVYIVDLSPSLLQIARDRFAKLNIDNVHCILEDACTFSIPHESIDLITMSYSLSMIPNFYSAIDHLQPMLKQDGVICCVDFGVQSKEVYTERIDTVGGAGGRHTPWLFRTFWKLWFETDRVFLDPARRDYLEYKFGTVKSLNLSNQKLGKIPYYIWLGCDKDLSPALLHRVNSLATESPYLAPIDYQMKQNDMKTSKGHEIALHNQNKNIPYPSMYYQKDIFRVYYDELRPEYKQFKNQYIYAFTWEDPREDHNILKFTPEDTVLAITSAGDNILSYASLPNPPKRIHCVDLNPCQGHLLELKLAAFKSLTKEEVWQMFGIGKIEDFNNLLINFMAPHMSSNALQYWYMNGEKTFGINGKGLYDTGFSKWAIRIAKMFFKVTGLNEDIIELCSAKTMKQQIQIWDHKIKPMLLNPIVSKLLVGNPLFLWKALGVPANQAALMGASVLQYVKDTFDPMVKRSLISTDNYFYYLCLQGKYSKNNCPDYLTEKAYKKFSSTTNNCLDRIRIHTDFLDDVFARLTPKTITIAIIMDHMDWFDEKGSDADTEIMALYQVLAPNGRVLLRSAATKPWYIENFEKIGFTCEASAVRTPTESIDRVNMYASTWVCTKTEKRRNMSVLQL